MELSIFKADPTSLEEARNQMRCLQLFEKTFKKQEREEDELELRTVRKLRQQLVEAKKEAKKIKIEKE
jgi:hypothetical protein